MRDLRMSCLLFHHLNKSFEPLTGLKEVKLASKASQISDKETPLHLYKSIRCPTQLARFYCSASRYRTWTWQWRRCGQPLCCHTNALAPVTTDWKWAVKVYETLDSNSGRAMWNLSFCVLCNLILYKHTERRLYSRSVYLLRHLRTHTHRFYPPSGLSERHCCDEGKQCLLGSGGPIGRRLSLWKPRLYRPHTDWRFLLQQH